ncbi:MAG: nucleotidyltransferase domain-containing protein, partial [Candidatus Hodarchaeota archaeon]
MPDLRARFNTALKDTVDEWKKHGKVKGIFVYGSFARGTLTATSDLDLGIIWDDVEPPAQLLSEHKAIRIDLTFLSTRAVKDVFEGRYTDPMIVADVVGKLKTAQVVHDKDGSLKKWQKTAAEFVWSEEAIENMKERASLSINSAMKNAETEDTISAIHDLRNGLFDLGRVIVMKNNIFSIMKPSEVLTEIRMLDPLA